MDEIIKLYPDVPKPIKESKLEPFSIDDENYKTLLTDKYKKRKPYEPIDPKIIKAVIPGIIRKHYVKPGSKVKKGDKLLVLEAMKMKNDILASETGFVDEIFVKVGERVPKDTILVTLKSSK